MMNSSSTLKALLSAVITTILVGCFFYTEVCALDIGPSRSIQVGAIPADAEIIFWSTRNTSQPMGPGYLYVVNVNGGNITQMTFDAHMYEHAAVSHDRRYIAANRYVFNGTENVSQLWVIDLKNKMEAQLVPSFYRAGGGGVDWSPDGFIFFSGQPLHGDSLNANNIFKIKPDGSQLTQLTFLVQDPTAIPPEPASLYDVSVSEDGSLVAYVRIVAVLFPDGSYGPKPQIWIMNSDGSNQRMIHDDGRPGGFYGNDVIGAYDPELSLDKNIVVFSQTNSNYINFAQHGAGTAHDIYVMNVDRTDLHRITQPGSISIIPDWQNGRILYTEYSEADNYTGLTITNPDGTGKRRLEPTLSLWGGGRHGKFIKPLYTPSSCGGQWTNCTNGYRDDTLRATASSSTSSSRSGTWSNYNLSVPASSAINNVTLRVDFFTNKSTGYVEVRVSDNGGQTYGPAHIVGGNTTEQTYLINVTQDLLWTATGLNNLTVKATCLKQGSGTNPTCNLDWISVQVLYTPFYFFISTSEPSNTISASDTSSTTVTVSTLGGISREVALSHSGCPPSATCAFSAPLGKPNFNSIFTVATSSSTPAGTYPITITATGEGKVNTLEYVLTVK